MGVSGPQSVQQVCRLEPSPQSPPEVSYFSSPFDHLGSPLHPKPRASFRIRRHFILLSRWQSLGALKLCAGLTSVTTQQVAEPPSPLAALSFDLGTHMVEEKNGLSKVVL